MSCDEQNGPILRQIGQLMSYLAQSGERLTQNGEPSTIIRAMERVRLWSSGLDGSAYDVLKAYLEQCNAFRDEQEYILKF